MNRNLCIAIGISILILLFSSCGDSSLFIPEIDEDEVEIKTIQEGTVLSFSDEIPLSLIYPPSYTGPEPDRMQIVLKSDDGEVLGNYEFGSDDLTSESLPSISLPSETQLDEGLYVIDISLFSRESIITQQQVEFFFSSGTYMVNGISAFPPTFVPGSSGLLSANISVPPGGDAYIRWLLEGNTLATGNLSEGFDEISIDSPSKEGVYSIKVELFPTEPKFGRQFDYSSSISLQSELYVSKSRKLGEYELGPAESYYSLFHFMGDLKDYGVRAKNDGAAKLAKIGTTRLDLEGDIYGYRIDEDSGFKLDDLLLPFIDGELSPFSVNFRFYLLERAHNRSIFSTQDGSSGFSFELRCNDEGSPFLLIEDGAASHRIPSGIESLETGRTTSLSLSASPTDKGILFMWFLDGFPVSVQEEEMIIQTQELSGKGISFIGGAGEESMSGTSTLGISAIIDEFGVYFRDNENRPAIDAGVFRAAMASRYGNKLIYAEGFEGEVLPTELLSRGRVVLDSGKLLIHPGAQVFFPDFLFFREELIVEIGLEGDASKQPSVLRFDAVSSAAEGANTDLFSINTKGSISAKGLDDIAFLAVETESLLVRIRHDNDRLIVSALDKEFSVAINTETFEGVEMELHQTEEAVVPLTIQHVLSWKESSRFAEGLKIPKK